MLEVLGVAKVLSVLNPQSFLNFLKSYFVSLKLVFWLAIPREAFMSTTLFPKEVFNTLCYPRCLTRSSCLNFARNKVGVNVQKYFVEQFDLLIKPWYVVEMFSPTKHFNTSMMATKSALS